MHLSGAEFRLADPRDLYPGDDRVSFVFAAVSAPDRRCAPPEHSGVLVQYEDATQCKLYTNPRIQQARFLLGMPRVHLRYFAEAWMDKLLAFIRRFHMPELHYWRYEDLPGADQFDAIDPADEAAREQAWARVKEALVAEAAEWMPKARELAAMLDHARRTGQLASHWFFGTPYQPLTFDFNIITDEEEEKRQILTLLFFTRGAFEEAVRAAIFGAGKGLDLHHVPLHFGDRDYALRTKFDPDTNKLHVEVRFAALGAPHHAIAADEVAR